MDFVPSWLKRYFSFVTELGFAYLWIRYDAPRDKKYLKQVSIFYSPLTFVYLCIYLLNLWHFYKTIYG